MSKVVGLRGRVVTETREPNDAAIREAEGLLERCRSGEVCGFVAVVQYFDNSAGQMQAGLMGYSTVGRLEGLKLEILEAQRGR
jgi:hypothetical protein